MAKAPQKTTRAAACQMLAPPAQAPTAPSPASVTSDATVTMGMIIPAGDRSTASSGMAAPEAKVAAEVSAACTGRADGDLGDAELVARVGAERILGHQLNGDLARQLGRDAALDVDLRQLLALARDIGAELARARASARRPRCRTAS